MDLNQSWLSSIPEMQKYIKVLNNVGLTAFIEDPRYKPPHTTQLLGGVQIKVATGRSTEFIMFDNDWAEFHGLVVTRNDNASVPDDKVIL